MSTNTIGNIVKNAREKRGLDLSVCATYLKIQIRFLQAIENDDYKIFENSYQAQGFFSNYAEFLDLNITNLLPRWKKDVSDFFPNEEFNVKKFYKPKKSRSIKIVLTMEKILYFFGALGVLIFFIYVYTTYQSTMYNPKLVITKPENNSIVETDIVDIFGKTDADAVLSLNNEKLTIQTDGNFSTSLKLSEGINNFKFSSVNPYGKETVSVLTIIYRPEKVQIYSPPQELQEDTSQKNSTPVSSTTTQPRQVVDTSPKTD
jgi:cytoskeletal protein RodZ